MGFAFWQLAFVAFPAIAILHLQVSPYTKVEESFNIQAIHDILQYGIPTTDVAAKFNNLFDHMTFSGAVPRSFIGSLIVSAIAKPEIWLGALAGKAAQTHVRAVLGGLNATAMAIFARAIERAYGPITATWYVALQASQFHLWYYASRTLPNMFAFFPSTIALSFLLPNHTSSLGPVKRTRLGLYLLTIATVIFRSELALLLGVHALWLLMKSSTLEAKSRLIRQVFVPSIIPGAVIAILLTVAVDSYLWQSPTLLWPELSAFVSNVFPTGDNQGASAWGTQPFYWYLVVALPRLLMNQFPMLDLFFTFPGTLSDFRILDNLIPSYAYLLIYSILPHKETRFMFPIVPSLTLVAALTCTKLTTTAPKKAYSRLLLYVAMVSTLVTALLSHTILLPLSAQNYPGGQSLKALHAYYQENWIENSFHLIQRRRAPEIHVHLTNLALQSGVTRFLEQPVPLEMTLEESFSTRRLPMDETHVQKRDPIILPGDADHPALTVRPNAPVPSAAMMPDRRAFKDPKWIYDKTSNESRFLEPMFWDRFDFLIVEDPHRAIGAWEIVEEIKALGRPRLLKREDQARLRYRLWDSVITPDEIWAYWTIPQGGGASSEGTTAVLHAMYPPFLSVPLANLHDLAHDILRLGKLLPTSTLTRGYWFEVPLETRLYVLRRASSGTMSNQSAENRAGHVVERLRVAKDGDDRLRLPEKASTDQRPLGMDNLGPLVVNKDGTVSRLDNWEQMTDQERKRTIEYLKKRNMLRLDEVEAVTE